ncbi:MAG: EamA family transporter, partial [Clostridia bacterium]|nr:EamA family transporter [Clostridia bacterium]
SAACWGFGLAAGIAEMTAFLLLNTGLRYATASKVAMISVSQLIFLTFLGQFFFHEPTNLFVWIGVALTCVGILMTTDLD